MPKIMIIDDNKDNSKLLDWILQDEGFEISVYDSAKPAIENLRQEFFDIVLMDISLPEIDGMEATKIIRNELKLSKLPIIAVTAHAIPDEVDKIMRSGVNELITKPIDEELLIVTIRRFLK